MGAQTAPEQRDVGERSSTLRQSPLRRSLLKRWQDAGALCGGREIMQGR